MDDIKKTGVDIVLGTLFPQVGIAEYAAQFATVLFLIIAAFCYLWWGSALWASIFGGLAAFLIVLQSIWYNMKYKSIF